MSLLLALFLIVHGSIHIGYVCGPAWPFAATDPWLVTVLGADPDTVRAVGIGLVLVTFAAFLLAAVAATGLVRSLWRPIVVIGSGVSAIVLLLFVTPWTLPGLAINALLVWATVVVGWRPTSFFGRPQRTADATPRPPALRRRDELTAPMPNRGFGG
jgi:hypothetical protein